MLDVGGTWKPKRFTLWNILTFLVVFSFLGITGYLGVAFWKGVPIWSIAQVKFTTGIELPSDALLEQGFQKGFGAMGVAVAKVRVGRTDFLKLQNQYGMSKFLPTVRISPEAAPLFAAQGWDLSRVRDLRGAALVRGSMITGVWADMDNPAAVTLYLHYDGH